MCFLQFLFCAEIIFAPERDLKLMIMIKIIIAILIINLTCFAEVNDWASRSGFQLLKVSSSSKITALGGAGAAVPADFALYSNPANYGNDSLYRLSFERLWRIEHTDLTINRFEVFFPVRDVFMAVSAQNHTVADIFIRDIFPGAPPQKDDFSADWQFSQLSFVVGYHRTKNFKWGLGLGFAFDKFLDEIAYAFIMNAGFIWKLLDDDLRLGLSFNNFGTTTPMINEDGGERWGRGEKLPTSIRAGAQYSNSIRALNFSVASDVLYWHIYDEQKGIAKNAADRLQFPLGLEISPINWLALRAGKTLGADYNIFNFGFGLNANFLEFDLAAATYKYETSVEWEFLAGVSLNFGNPKKSKE